ncbi:DUF222 domain-containing protein [Geodermatophilus sp. SYSU D00710]
MEEVAEHRSPVEQALLAAVIATPAPFRRLPVALLSREQKAAELQRVARLEAMTAAYEAELVLGLADDSPDDDDPPPGTPGARAGSWAPDTELPGVSEFFTAELAVVLNCGRGTANHLAHRAWTYRERLPATWAALAAGELDEARARALVDVLEHAPAGIARRIEAALLPDAAQWTVGRLEQQALALLLDLDTDAVGRRKEQARRRADVRVDPSPLEGMATLAADLPVEVAAACEAVIDGLARMLRADGDPRPIGELRCAVVADLIQRPWQTGPAVTAQLTIIAGWHAQAATGTPTASTSRTAGVRCWTGPTRSTATPPPRRSRRSCAPATAPAGSPPAGSGSAGPTPTTSSPTPTAGPPTAPTCAACAAPTTGSRPSPAAGASP